MVIPAWVEEQFNSDRVCWLFPHNTLDLAMKAYQRLLSDFLKKQEKDSELSFAKYIGNQLVERSYEL